MNEYPVKNTTPSDSEIQHSFKTEVWETIRFIVIALIIVVPIRFFIAQPFIVSGESMDPTFQTGQYLIVDELSYNIGNPKRGDVAIFKYPKNPTQYFIKRVIGLPGETVSITEGHVSIKDSLGKVALELSEPYVEFTKNDTTDYTLGLGEYFMMGDNRAGSFDSRAWGPVQKNLFIGKAFLRLFPFTKISVLPGQVRQ